MAAKTKAVRGRKAVAVAVPRTPDPAPMDALTMALQRAFQMTTEDAEAVAAVVHEAFAGTKEVNDERIDAEVRSLFYTLEGQRILAFRREEYETAEGQKRRAFWWRMRPEVVAELSTTAGEDAEPDVYAALPAECWQRSTPAEAAEA
jgi:hypothetical protein